MIIQLFRSRSTELQLLLLFFLLAINWACIIIWPAAPVVSVQSPVFAYLNEIFQTLLTWQQLAILILINLILLLTAGFQIRKLGLLHNQGHLPVFIFGVLLVYLSRNQNFIPALVAMLFLVPAYGSMLLTHQKRKPMKRMFNAGLFLSLGILLDIRLVGLGLFSMMLIIIFQHFNWRIWISHVTGMVFPWVYLISFNWMFGDGKIGFQYLNQFSELFLTPELLKGEFATGLNIAEIISIVLFGLLGLISVIRIFSRIGERVIVHRKIYRAMLWLILSVLLMMGFASSSYEQYGMYMMFPVSVFIAEYFDLVKRQRIHNIWILLIIISSIVGKLPIF